MPLSFKDTSSPLGEPLKLDDAKAQLTVDAEFTADDDLISALIVAARVHVENLMQRAIFPRSVKQWFDRFPYEVFPFAIRLQKAPCLSVESITYIAQDGTTQTIDPARYRVDVNSEPARIVPLPGSYWPYVQLYLTNTVCVSFTAGAFVEVQTDPLTVPAAPGPYAVVLTRAADALGMVSLTDSLGAPVAYGNVDGTLTVDAAFAGQTINAAYYVPALPAPVRQAMLLLISYWYAHRDAAEAQPPKAIEMGVDALLKPYTFETVL